MDCSKIYAPLKAGGEAYGAKIFVAGRYHPSVRLRAWLAGGGRPGHGMLPFTAPCRLPPARSKQGICGKKAVGQKVLKRMTQCCRDQVRWQAAAACAAQHGISRGSGTTAAHASAPDPDCHLHPLPRCACLQGWSSMPGGAPYIARMTRHHTKPLPPLITCDAELLTELAIARRARELGVSLPFNGAERRWRGARG